MINTIFNVQAALFMVTLASPGGAAIAQALKEFTGDLQPTAFVLDDLLGNPHALNDYRGQVVLLNFWATWCPPCVHEMPSMQQLSVKMTGKPFSIIAVNLAEEAGVIKSFLERMEIDFTIVLDRDGVVSRDWQVFAYPSSFLLDSSGQISHVRYGEADWSSSDTISLIESMLPVEQ